MRLGLGCLHTTVHAFWIAIAAISIRVPNLCGYPICSIREGDRAKNKRTLVRFTDVIPLGLLKFGIVVDIFLLYGAVIFLWFQVQLIRNTKWSCSIVELSVQRNVSHELSQVVGDGRVKHVKTG